MSDQHEIDEINKRMHELMASEIRKERRAEIVRGAVVGSILGIGLVIHKERASAREIVRYLIGKK